MLFYSTSRFFHPALFISSRFMFLAEVYLKIDTVVSDTSTNLM